MPGLRWLAVAGRAGDYSAGAELPYGRRRQPRPPLRSARAAERPDRPGASSSPPSRPGPATRPAPWPITWSTAATSTPTQRAAVEAMVALHLKKHGGDAEKSLAAIPAGRSTRESLAAARRPRDRGNARPRRLGRLDRAERRRPHRHLLRRHGHLRRPAVPRPAAPCAGRPGCRLRGAGQRAAPRGGPQADPRPARRRPDQPPALPRWRPRSPAGWSTPASSRSTAWGPTATAGPTTPCGSSAATRSRRPSTSSTPTRR